MLRHALRAYYKLMYSTGDFFCVSTILLHNPSLNNQSCMSQTHYPPKTLASPPPLRLAPDTH